MLTTTWLFASLVLIVLGYGAVVSAGERDARRTKTGEPSAHAGYRSLSGWATFCVTGAMVTPGMLAFGGSWVRGDFITVAIGSLLALSGFGSIWVLGRSRAKASVDGPVNE